MERTSSILLCGLLAGLCLLLSACEKEAAAPATQGSEVAKPAPQVAPMNKEMLKKDTMNAAPVEMENTSSALAEVAQQGGGNTQFEIGNTRYLFDISNHTPEEMQALLSRAEEIRETHADGYEELEIVLVLHGPDIDIFREQNYTRHKPLVDLAARLDAFDIIDMRICETTMSSMGVERSEVPAFIESVPYAPREISRLLDEGYINL